MKNQKLLIGFAIGVTALLLISAYSPQSETAIPRYNISMSSGSTGFVYDSVTGEYKVTTISELKKNNSIKELLQQP